MRRLILALVACGCVAVARPSLAQERCTGWGPRNAISERPLAFTSLGAGLQYERFALPPRFSIAIGGAFRAAARGDFSSRSEDLGGEVRWWLRGRSPGQCIGRRSMIGPYAAARVDVERTSVAPRSEPSRDLGATWTLGEMALFGWRVVVWRVVELSLFVGTGLYTEFDAQGRFSPMTAPTAMWGFTYGWVF